MDTSRSRLVVELQELSLGLHDSNTLIFKEVKGSLLCQFLSHGLVSHTFTITSEVLATALWQVSSMGIIDGSDFSVFKNVFNKFSLHVKARQVYTELGVKQPELDLDLQTLLVA